MSECKVGTHVFVEEICPHCGFTLQDALNQAETRITELEWERDELKCKLCECDKDYTQDMVWIKCLNLQERHRLEVENATLRTENTKLKEKLEYFSDKNTEYLNELWELKKENALLKRKLNELVEGK